MQLNGKIRSGKLWDRFIIKDNFTRGGGQNSSPELKKQLDDIVSQLQAIQQQETELLSKISALQSQDTTLASKIASVETIANNALPISKITNSTSITADAHVVSAKQLNPSIDGTIAKQIAELKSNMGSFITIDHPWLQNGKADDIYVKYEDNDRFSYQYDFGTIPSGYKFLLAVPHILWYSSHIYFDTQFEQNVLLTNQGEAFIYAPDRTETTTTIPIVCCAFRICIRDIV